MELKTTFSHYYPEGSIGGECAVFAEKLEQFGPVGDTLASKTAYVRKYGILRENLGGHYEIGDVVIIDVGVNPITKQNNGHVFLVNDIVGNQLQATESNFKLDKKVHHTRIVPVSTKIIGVIRNCPLKVAIINPEPPPLQKTFMQVTIVANNNNWKTLADQVHALSQYFIKYSGDRLETVGNIVESHFTTTPLVPFLGQEGTKSSDPNWYRSNITPLCTGQISLLVLNPEDYPNGNTWGFMTYGDPHRPVRCEISPKENIPAIDGTPIFVTQAFHEICHALFFLTGQPDRVHDLIYPLPGNPKAILDLIDYKRLQAALVNINNK